MLNEQEIEASPRPRRMPWLRVVPAHLDAPIEAPRAPIPQRGAPRTADEWTALVRVGSGEKDIPAAQCERLRALRLVLTVGGVPTLTRHGRVTLGLPA